MINTDYSIVKTFITKDIFVFDQTEKWRFVVTLRPIGDFFTDYDYSTFYNTWTNDSELKRLFKIKNANEFSSFDLFCSLVFEFGYYKEYTDIANTWVDQLKQIVPGLTIDYINKQFLIPNQFVSAPSDAIVATEDIWNYIIYLLKVSNGEKVSPPEVFANPEDKRSYLAQKEREERIARIKMKAQQADNSKQKQAPDSLIKTFLSITYAFPSVTFDWLANQTMAQIHWLAQYAAGSVSYEVNSAIFAAGNMKKGSKLDFFIK